MRLIVMMFAVAILFTGCNNEDLGTVVKQERSLEPFDVLSINAVSKVNIIQSEDYKVEIITNGGLLQHVHTQVVDGKLYLDLSGRHKKIDELTFFVFTPYLKEIDVEDVTDVFSETGWETESLLIRKHDVGDITLNNLILENLRIKTTDVGNIRLSGNVNTQTLEIDDVASVFGFDMISNETNITQTGVGDVYVYALEKLKIDLSGVGSVYYKGDPEEVEIRNTGVGKVVKQ